MWKNSMLPTELISTISVLLAKGTTDIQGIWLLEVLYKLLQSITDTSIKRLVMLYDALNVFCSYIGTEMAILKLKIDQELVIINQYPIIPSVSISLETL